MKRPTTCLNLCGFSINCPAIEEQAVEPEKPWQKEAQMIANYIDCFIFVVSMAMLVYHILIKNSTEVPMIRAALCFTTLRLFTVFTINRNLMVLLFKVIPEFLSLFVLTVLFMLFFGQIGTSLFNGAYDNMLPEDKPPSNFNTMWDSFVTLLQLLVGEGWHEVMYKTVLAMNFFGYSVYFLIYVFCITLIVTNLFIGLILSSVELIQEEREKEDVEAANSVKPPDQRFKEIEKEIRKIQKEAHREIALRLSEKQKLFEDQSQGTQFFSTATVL